MRNSRLWTLFSLYCLVQFANSSPVLHLNQSRAYFNQSKFIQSTCRYIPGDTGWPNASVWDELNSTVSGGLIANVPIASACYQPNYDRAKCSFLKEQWDLAPVHVDSPSSIMMPYFQDGACDPFHTPNQTCSLGNLAEYSIQVTKASDVIAGVSFARKNNIRLVIKNTGHDFGGQSTGKGALSLWTRHYNSIEIFNYTDVGSYSGPAMKIGSGAQAYEMYEAAHNVNHRVMGGACPTVGPVGGFTQGGGHSPLSSTYGLGADNVLEWEVVTASGDLLVASPTENPDLYWALSGGGAGTFGVVLSMTTKLYPESQVGGATLSFNTSETTLDEFWDAVSQFHEGVEPLVDGGATALSGVTNTTFSTSITAPNTAPLEIREKLAYITSHLKDNEIPYTLSITSDPTYFDHYVRYFGPLPDGIYPASHLISSRLFPRSTIQEKPDAIIESWRKFTANGEWVVAPMALNVAHGNVTENAVNPAWRSTLLHTLIYSPWDWQIPKSKMVARQEFLTNVIDPTFVGLTPDSGTYLNEANFNMSNKQVEFYGSNLDRLRKIKKTYDPDYLFYTLNGIGNEAWNADIDGRLCRA